MDHTGNCGEYRYEAGVPVELPEDVVAALGDHAKPVDEDTEDKNVDTAPENKMVDGKKKKLTNK